MPRTTATRLYNRPWTVFFEGRLRLTPQTRRVLARRKDEVRETAAISSRTIITAVTQTDAIRCHPVEHPDRDRMRASVTGMGTSAERGTERPGRELDVRASSIAHPTSSTGWLAQ